MKKVLVLVLTASVMLNSSIVAFAADTQGTNQPSITPQTTISNVSASDPTDLTSPTDAPVATTPNSTERSALSTVQQKSEFYANTYMPAMTSIVNLRAQTQSVVQANNAVSNQIRSGLNSLKYNDMSTQITAAEQAVSNDKTQLSNLTKQADALKAQFTSSTKSQNTNNMQTIQSQYQSLVTKIATLTSQLASDQAKVKSLTSQATTNITQFAQYKQQLQPQIQQVKTLASKIKQEEIDKNQLWNTYNASIKANDFTSAGNTLQSIIGAKTQIIQDISSRGTALNQLLTAINRLASASYTAPNTVNTTTGSAIITPVQTPDATNISITNTPTSDPSTGLTSPTDTPTATAPNPTESTALTTEQQRSAFYANVYMPDMISVVNLRIQTQSIVQANNTISDQIRSGLNSLKYNDASTQITAAEQAVSNDKTQLSNLTKQANALKAQFASSTKSQDTNNMQTIQSQYQALVTQIATLTNQLASDQAAVKSSKPQATTNDAQSAQYTQQLQPQIQQVSTLASKIKQEEIFKNQLWSTYNANIKANDFTSAGNTLQSIITAKTQIIQDINSRQTALKQLLTAVNTLASSISTAQNTVNTTTGSSISMTSPISLYHGDTNITFNSTVWGDVAGSVTAEGVGGTNCIKYSNLINNPYSPGPGVIFASPTDISNMADSDRLQLIMNTGTVPISQAVRIIFNGDPSISIVTPKLGKANVFQIVTLDISSIRAKLGGQITQMSFEGAGPNGWQGVSNLYVNDISIVRPTDSKPIPAIIPVPVANSVSDSFPISIYNNGSNVNFNPAYWGSITAQVAKENSGDINCIKYSNLMNNVYAPSPEVVFPNPINITSMIDSDKLQVSMFMGKNSPSQSVMIIFNGDPSMSIVTPKIDTTTGFKTLNLDISKIRAKLGGQITQVSFESAGPNGWNNVSDLSIDQISIVRP